MADVEGGDKYGCIFDTYVNRFTGLSMFTCSCRLKKKCESEASVWFCIDRVTQPRKDSDGECAFISTLM